MTEVAHSAKHKKIFVGDEDNLYHISRQLTSTTLSHAPATEDNEVDDQAGIARDYTKVRNQLTIGGAFRDTDGNIDAFRAYSKDITANPITCMIRGLGDFVDNTDTVSCVWYETAITGVSFGGATRTLASATFGLSPRDVMYQCNTASYGNGAFKKHTASGSLGSSVDLETEYTKGEHQVIAVCYEYTSGSREYTVQLGSNSQSADAVTIDGLGIYVLPYTGAQTTDNAQVAGDGTALSAKIYFLLGEDTTKES